MRGGPRKKIVCARDDCNKKFYKRVHNQKYCSSKCCQKATNAKLLKRYYEGKRPIPPNRVCRSRGCKTVLSIYNKDDVCGSCRIKEDLKVLNKRAKNT